MLCVATSLQYWTHAKQTPVWIEDRVGKHDTFEKANDDKIPVHPLYVPDDSQEQTLCPKKPELQQQATPLQGRFP